MPFSAYDSGVRLFSGFLADATISSRQTTGRHLDEAEASELNKRIVRSFMEAYDSGERDSDALERAAVRSALRWPKN